MKYDYNKTVFSLTALLHPNLLGFKNMWVHFLNLEKKSIVWLYILLKITEIAFSELKPETKKLITED